jgi:predicted  nucleic acid-binding Zn-ribbon protein
MSLAEQLYKLQQIDLELQKKQRELNEIGSQLSDDKALVAAESNLASQKEQLEDARRKQKGLEWELEDIQEKVRQIDNKLYSGKTKDPKELLSLEKEVKSLRSQVRPKEDALLAAMSQVEELETEVKATAERVKRLKQEWEQRQGSLGQKKSEVESVLAELKRNRSELTQQMQADVVGTYERLREVKGQAVVKVERGKCQGCHITVPTSQWQKARAGELIQCNSCGRILYLE